MRQEAEESAIGSVCEDCGNPYWRDCMMRDTCEAFKEEVEATLQEWSEEE